MDSSSTIDHYNSDRISAFDVEEIRLLREY